ncbi:MAG: Lrp/AsnC family transcriptional regulator [Nanoarchaeota archaeon]|nr:Lrp/AsnC family transcriptional regulator [Nanoarchaeota archaeon]
MGYIIDDKDQKILDVLKDNADYTTRQIAKKTLLPVTTIHHRIKRLRKEKIIKKYSVELDYSKVGRSLLVYILISVNLPFLKKQRKSQYDVAKEVRKFGFVERIDIVTGGTDMVAMLRVKDVAEFDKVLLGKLQLIEGISNTQSLMVIHEE